MRTEELDDLGGLSELLNMLRSHMAEAMVMQGSPNDVTREDMVKGADFMRRAAECKTVDDFKALYEWANHWHSEPGLGDSDYRHAYVHAVRDVLPMLSVVYLGAAALQVK